MADIFEHTILCKNCTVPTSKGTLVKDGFEFRILQCPQCNDVIYHPRDMKEYEDFKTLRQRDFDVKLRLVGNSFCVSIPKEIIDFHKQFEKEFNDLVRLHLEGPGKINILFMSRNIYNPSKDEE